MANPIGEESWLAYVEESKRNLVSLEQRVNVVEIYKNAIGAEPDSLRVWLSYCEFFWSLWADCQSGEAGWSDEEQVIGRELFSFGAALDLWQQGYEAIQYRLGDSHILWNRWISLEMELLAKTKTPEGIRRITHLFRDRLTTPHVTWDNTSQMFSSFLSEYNRRVWEDSMKEITAMAQQTKRQIANRDPFELRLNQAAREADSNAMKTVFAEYLHWEVAQCTKSHGEDTSGMDICLGLFGRALTGVFATDENVWHEYVAFLSKSQPSIKATKQLLDIIRRAVQHCPWSGRLWNRYILYAEEARLQFSEVESIKHAATSENQLYKNGMESMIEMYVAWCGFLKRTAMDTTATDEAIDLADVGLSAALEDVEVVGQRLYGKTFQGDPKFRLERIYIQYLTEKKGAIDEARAKWDKLANLPIHANSYDFWLCYYMWEMFIFSSSSSYHQTSMQPSFAGFKTPSLATAVLQRAVTHTTIDWPERVLEVYVQHCNDFEPSQIVRRAMDEAYELEKGLTKRHTDQEHEKFGAYLSYSDEQGSTSLATAEQSSSQPKRKREEAIDIETRDKNARKRTKNSEVVEEFASESKRDRENTTVIVTNLPPEVTQTKIRHYFKEYGHISSVVALVKENDGTSATAMIEFGSSEEAKSALLRDDKYFGEAQIKVQSGHKLTVYVANFPPTADETYIRNLFKDSGDILSIRWPSLKVNTHRRFCYVSFRRSEASAKAVQKDGLLLDRRYNLVAKYSDPGQRKSRDGALAEGREVYISGLNHATAETEICNVFSKYGNISRINIPRNMSGKGKGFAFVDFQSKAEAELAVAELNNAKFGNQILQVEISKVSKVKPSAHTIHQDRISALPVPEGEAPGQFVAGSSTPSPTEISSRTIALMGFPDTVNDARIRAFVEPFGQITHLTLQPGHGGAKIEFVDSAVAGRASLQLDNAKFEGFTIRVGTLEDLRKSKPGSLAEHHLVSNSLLKGAPFPPRVFQGGRMPHAVRRPVLGKLGQIRGLGFHAKKLGATMATKETKAGTGEYKPVPTDTVLLKSSPKSNADFKAMLLTRRTASKDKDKEAHENDV